VHRERSFFGVLKVTRASDGTFMNLSHGTTLHGKQWLIRTTVPSRSPTTIGGGRRDRYFPSSRGEEEKTHRSHRVRHRESRRLRGGRPGDRFLRDRPGDKEDLHQSEYFTFLSDCRARWRVILGDARLTMEKAPPNHYGIIILDAFSSDAIPVHLLTREAVNLYLSKLEHVGVLLIHITNRYVNLAPMLAKMADENGFACRLRDDESDYESAKDGSTWVLLARSESDLGALPKATTGRR